MRRKKKKLILLAAVVFALLYGISQMLAPKPAPVQVAAPVKQEYKILVAKKNLTSGTFVKSDFVEWVSWPEDKTHDAYLGNNQYNLKDFQGAVVRFAITKGEPVTNEKLVRPGEQGFLAATLTPGMRAASVGVNATTGISGFVFPGDRVDIILTHAIRDTDNEDRPQRQASETVLTNLRVLAIDQEYGEDEQDPKVAKNVTLEVTPKQAEILAVTQDLGTLRLSLRSLAQEFIPTFEVTNADDSSEAGDVTFQQLLPYHVNNASNSTERGYTWDSDASFLLDAAEQNTSVQVMRGSETYKVNVKEIK